MSEQLYLLKIQLLRIKPTVWRRFVVPSSITLDRLHDVIQIVMGWEDRHLYSFTIGEKQYTEQPESWSEGVVCGELRLGDLVTTKGFSFQYLYDFGDSWKHKIVLENDRFSNSELPFPLFCLEGKGVCPPEDVGGEPGYYALLEALKDPGHELHESYVELLGDDFGKEPFDPEESNWFLMKYLRWSRDRQRRWGESGEM